MEEQRLAEITPDAVALCMPFLILMWTIFDFKLIFS